MYTVHFKVSMVSRRNVANVEIISQCIIDTIEQIFVNTLFEVIISCSVFHLTSAVSLFTVIFSYIQPTIPPVLFHKSIPLTALHLRHIKDYNDFSLSKLSLFLYKQTIQIQIQIENCYSPVQDCVGLLSYTHGYSYIKLYTWIDIVSILTLKVVP